MELTQGEQVSFAKTCSPCCTVLLDLLGPGLVLPPCNLSTGVGGFSMLPAGVPCNTTSAQPSGKEASPRSALLGRRDPSQLAINFSLTNLQGKK